MYQRINNIHSAKPMSRFKNVWLRLWNSWGIISYTHGWNVWGEWFLAVNQHNHENWVPSILTHNLWLIFMGMKPKKKKKWPPQKDWVFQNRQFSIFFVKISWIGLGLVELIDWCQGHWCGLTFMAVRLSDISSITGKKCIFCVLGRFWAYVGQPHSHIG